MTVTLSGLALIACTYGLARYGYGLFLPVFRSEFGLSNALSGAIAAGGLAAYCLAAALAYRLVGRGRPRLASTLAGALAALGCAGIAVAPSAVPFSASVLVAGCGAGLASPGMVALVAGARAQAIVNAGTGAGVLVSGPLALLFGQQQWRIAWLCFAVLTVAATAAVLASTTLLPDASAAPVERSSAQRPLSRLRPAIVAAGLLGIGSSAVWTFGHELAGSAARPGTVGSILFWTLLGAAGLGGALVGDAVQRWAVPRTWVLLVIASSAATMVLALYPGNAAASYLCAVVFGAGYVALTGVLIAWAAALIPANEAGAIAILFIVLNVGQAIGSLLVGALLDVSDPIIAFGVATAISLASALPAFGRRRRRRGLDLGRSGHRVPANVPP